MFSKNKRKVVQPISPVRTVPSIISADLKIIGDLESSGEVQIDGEVSGDIRSKVLLIGESATIKGEILAETVRVHGSVYGQIKAKFVNLAKTAHVVGDILHENLSIQEGAFLEGHMTHMSEQDVKAMDAAATAKLPKAATASTGSRPGEDRVNLVVKSGPSMQKHQPHKQIPTPPLNPHQSSIKTVTGK